MLYIKDPLCFKESITISLEVFSGSGEFEFLQDFIGKMPSTVSAINFDISMEIEKDLLRCIYKFKETKTFYYLREDFKNILYDIEIQLNKKMVS
jgi:hypothetical protein